MITVRHFFDGEHLHGTSQDGFFLLGNEVGDYLSFSSVASSKYHGWVLKDGDRYVKILDSFTLPGDQTVKAISLYPQGVERTFAHLQEETVLSGSHAFSLAYNQVVTIEPLLDLRPLSAFPEWGREHNVTVFPDRAVVRASVLQESFFIVGVSDRDRYETVASWWFKTYLQDRLRNSLPAHRYLFVPFRLEGRRFGFGVARDPDEAYELARRALRNHRLSRSTHLVSHLPSRAKIPARIRAAYASAGHSLSLLHLPRVAPHWLRAGLPWFHDVWARDALISVSAFPLSVQVSLLEHFWHVASQHYFIPASSAVNQVGADALGWLVLRTSELPTKERRRFVDHYSSFLTLLVEKLLLHNTRDGFAVHGGGETWMDSLERSGARLELQALRIRIYRFLAEATGKQRFYHLAERLKMLVRQTFWNGHFLADGFEDPTIRSNIVLAAYICPDLLSEMEWKVCFQTALTHLYLPWGGISSLDIRDPRYRAESTGENPASYHNGDSWFYINNMAAMVLLRFKDEFDSQIQTILHASTEEILFKGALGHHAELSSAGSCSSQGAWAQAWSNALYIELVKKLFLHP
jgi:hypothetical protein